MLSIATKNVNVNYLKVNEHKDFKDMLMLYGFKQVITEPTHITNDTATLIDLILSNNETVIKSTMTLFYQIMRLSLKVLKIYRHLLAIMIQSVVLERLTIKNSNLKK